MSDFEELTNDIVLPNTDEEEYVPEDLSALAAAGGTEGDRRRRHDRSRRRELKHKTVEVTATISGVAIVYLLAGLVQLKFMPTPTTGLVALSIGVLYGGIACWARLSPFRAATTAVVFFSATFVTAMISDPRAALHASNFVLVALIFALILARQHRKLEQKSLAMG